MRTTLFSVLFLLGIAAPGVASVDDQRTWQFSVLLDDAPIGHHRFDVLPTGQGVEVRSEASFDVRFLFFNAFRYRHSTRELWDGECLQVIESSTQQNDEEFAVVGRRASSGLVVEVNGREDRLEGCVMSFAYWNPKFLEQPRLLDPQSGEYVVVDVEPLGAQELVVRGQSVIATAYQLKARNVDMTLYYSADDEWLGLESVARGGRIIRYVLT